MHSMRVAWWAWFGMLVLPFLIFLAVLITLQQTGGPGADTTWGSRWFIANIIFLGVTVPLGFWLRGRLFSRYYQGEAVDPRKYLIGMLSVWIPLVLGGLLSLVSIYVSRSLTPNIIPAAIAFVFYITQWPKGSAMLRPRGEKDDPEMYEEPR